MNGMSTLTLWPILHYPSCNRPIIVTHDQKVDETQATEDTQQETIDCVITKEEVLPAIKKLKSRKAPGPDGIYRWKH